MEIIQRMRAEREALVARIEQIDKMLADFESWAREANRLFSSTAGITAPSFEAHQDSPSLVESNEQVPANSPSTVRVKTPTKEFQAAVIDILRSSQAPMDRLALYEALVARNIVIGDGDRAKELNVLSARVYRMMQDGKLVHHSGEGYGVVNQEDNEEREETGSSEPDNSGGTVFS